MSGDYSHLVGHRFPGGSVTIPGWLDWLWRDAVLADSRAEGVHPGLAYLAAVQGSGVTFQDIFDLAEASAESGPMFGEQTLTFAEALRADVQYAVEGEITEVVRKHGRRAGTFDMLTFELRLRDPAGEVVATNVNTFIFPRPGGGEG
jgi:N-terminal half of MaoC dehydratase